MSKIKRLYVETRTLLRSVPAMLIAALVAAVVAMNLLANKSIDLNLSWLALDCGILFSWVAFLVMDIVTRHFGVKAANILSIFALFVNLAMALLFLAASYIPGTWSQSYVENGAAVNVALDDTFASSWFVILGSSVAFVVSAVVNNVLHHAIAKLFRRQNFAAFSVSSYISTFVGQFVDNLLFALIVSLHFFGWSLTQCLMCAVTGAVAELLFEIVFSPIGYRIVRRMQADGVGQAYLDLVQRTA